MDLMAYVLATPVSTEASIRNEESRNLVSTVLNKWVLTEKIHTICGNIIQSAYSIVQHHSSQHLESLLLFSWVLLSAYQPCKLKIHPLYQTRCVFPGINFEYFVSGPLVCRCCLLIE